MQIEPRSPAEPSSLEPVDRTEPNRPSIQSAAASPTALSNLLASCLLLACFFLPHSVGCDDKSHRPINLAAAVVSNSDGASDILAFLIFWPYALAAATLVTFVTLVCWRPAWFDAALLGLPVGSALMLSSLWMILLFSGSNNSRAAMVIAATVAPTATCVAARMVWLHRAGNRAAAATWGQSFLCVLAVFSLRWFWNPPVNQLQWGGMLSIAAAILMMLASWTWMTRARHDLLDRKAKPLAFQVSLRQMIIAVTLTAIALTYWQALGR